MVCFKSPTNNSTFLRYLFPFLNVIKIDYIIFILIYNYGNHNY